MDNWQILKKELATFGIELFDEYCIVNEGKSSFSKQIKTIKKKLDRDISVFKEIWMDIFQLLSETGSNMAGRDRSKLFVFCIKDMDRMLGMFDGLNNTTLKNCIKESLYKDVCMFCADAINDIPKYKICLDYIYRSISQSRYIINMLFFAKLGVEHVNGEVLKLEKSAEYSYGNSISGPWANLDLPTEERVFSFDSESDHFKETEKAKQSQRRYRKPLINYNGIQDPSEGAFWVWYEPKNFPFEWKDREDESPYPSRPTMMGLG